MMAPPQSQSIPHGKMHLLQQQQQQQKKLQNGGLRPGHMKNMSSNITKAGNGTHAGDVVSDESESGDEEGDCTAIEDDSDNDSDEADGFALSGASRIGNKGAMRLAGLAPTADFGMDDQAVAGAQLDSEDEDYDAVEDISDSEDEAETEKLIRRQAEKDLIEEYEATERPRTANVMASGMNDMSLKEDAALARRLSLQSQSSQLSTEDQELDLDMNNDPFDGAPFLGDTQFEMWDEAEGLFDNDLASWRNPDAAENTLGLMDILTREHSAPSITNQNQKRVRFEETASSRSSSVSSEEDPRETFGDLFDSRDDLAVRQQLMFSGVDADAVQDGESVYESDIEDPYESTALQIDTQTDSGSDDSDDESDGSTTDEEDPEEALARARAFRAAREARKGKVVPANTPDSQPSTPVPSKRSPPAVAGSKGGKAPAVAVPRNNARPRMGTFARDPTRASVTADVQGSGVKMVCPTKPPEEDRAYWERVRQKMGSRDGSPGGSVSWNCGSPRTTNTPLRALTARSTLGTMFDGNLDFLRNNDENGIAGDLIPGRADSVQSSFTTATLANEEDSDDESDVQMEDFIELSDSESETDEMPSTITSPTSSMIDDSVFDSPAYSRPGTSSGLLDHLEQQRGLVSSFRNNQRNVRQVTSLPANPSQRAKGQEQNAFPKGRRGAANAPITPARKKRQSQDFTNNAGISKTASPIFKSRRRSRGISINGIDETLAMDRFAGSNH